MQLQRLRGLPVVDPVNARRIGSVSDYRLDAVAGRLAALEVDQPDGAGGALVAADAIRRVGRHAVMLTGASTGTVEDDEAWLGGRSLVGLPVLAEDGTALGRLEDADIDPDSLMVVGYRLQAPLVERVFGRQARPQALVVVSSSRELLVVAQPTAGVAAGEEPVEGPADADAGAGSPTTPLPTLKHEDQPASEPPALAEAEPAAEPPTGAAEAARSNGRRRQ
jgi:sporulation protein YlmC with PRC-barrel domain